MADISDATRAAIIAYANEALGKRGGPVMSSDLYGHMTHHLEKTLSTIAENTLDDLRHRLEGNVAPLLRKAYADGLRDGFAQGVASRAAGAVVGLDGDD